MFCGANPNKVQAKDLEFVHHTTQQIRSANTTPTVVFVSLE
jgi:hypothetical protein